MPVRITVFFALLVLLCAGLSAAKPDPATAAKASAPQSLQEVMQKLAADAQTIELGLLMNNRPLIEQGARAIANHPKPKDGITPFLKDKTQAKAVVRSLDELVHKTAAQIADQAPKAAMLDLARMNAAMIEGCIGCHDVFRN